MRKIHRTVIVALGLAWAMTFTAGAATATAPPRPDPLTSSPTHVADQCVSLFNWAWDIDTQYENYLGWQDATLDNLKAENARQAQQIKRLRAQVRRLSHHH